MTVFSVLARWTYVACGCLPGKALRLSGRYGQPLNEASFRCSFGALDCCDGLAVVPGRNLACDLAGLLPPIRRHDMYKRNRFRDGALARDRNRLVRSRCPGLAHRRLFRGVEARDLAIGAMNERCAALTIVQGLMFAATGACAAEDDGADLKVDL